MKLTVRGSWPDPIVLRSGWARADARRVNRSVPDGHLHLMRGGSPFLAAATKRILEFGAPSMVSPPLVSSAQHVWRTAGYRVDTPLRLLRLDLNSPPESPQHPIEPLDHENWAQIVAVDEVAFGDAWTIEEHGLREALKWTRFSRLLGVFAQGDLAGFAVVGSGTSLAYLQRVAVHPKRQGEKIGSALTRASALWARSKGARAMLLNTRPENEAALRLYASEGFSSLPERLDLLRFTPT